MIEFSAPIEEAMGGGAVVGIPEAVVEESGGGGRIPIRATFDGISYQGSIVSMGGRHVLGVLKAIRTELGKVPGEQILVAVERDNTERTVTILAELESLLVENPSARATFDKLSYAHQREYVNHIREAKKPETRVRRAKKAAERLIR